MGKRPSYPEHYSDIKAYLKAQREEDADDNDNGGGDDGEKEDGEGIGESKEHQESETLSQDRNQGRVQTPNSVLSTDQDDTEDKDGNMSPRNSSRGSARGGEASPMKSPGKKHHHDPHDPFGFGLPPSERVDDTGLDGTGEDINEAEEEIDEETRLLRLKEAMEREEAELKEIQEKEKERKALQEKERRRKAGIPEGVWLARRGSFCFAPGLEPFEEVAKSHPRHTHANNNNIMIRKQ